MLRASRHTYLQNISNILLKVGLSDAIILVKLYHFSVHNSFIGSKKVD